MITAQIGRLVSRLCEGSVSDALAVVLTRRGDCCSALL